MTLIDRTAVVTDHTGRTIEGTAYVYDSPSRVSDGGPSYLEAFSRGAAAKSITERGRMPLGVLHPWSSGRGQVSPVPIGAVDFEESDTGLRFQAVISRTQAGDEMLELVNDGAMRSVSISAKPIKHVNRGGVVFRTEIALRELSLVPTGMGAHAGAEIEVVRNEQPTIETPRLLAARRKLMLAH